MRGLLDQQELLGIQEQPETRGLEQLLVMQDRQGILVGLAILVDLADLALLDLQEQTHQY
jgi:hypothetical protein